MYSQSNTFVLSISNFILKNAESLLLSTNTDYSNLLQNINAEKSIQNETYRINNPNSNTNRINQVSSEDSLSIGAWAPLNHSLVLQNLKDEKLKNAIYALLNLGFHEYYFAMNNFEDIEYSKVTEKLLKAAEQTDLKIIIILRPPSEGDSNTNYD
ncbi:MAG TPA: hypothetical protein VFK40_12350 [Nitrososphaeraceae archaeon]|nr:hypothetical protein [Nitrososphaeraceae archaeon]